MADPTDEFETIRSAFPEQPGPSPEVTAQARRQVQDLVRAELTGSRRDRWRAAVRSGRIGIAVTATTAIVALTALSVPLLRSADPGSGPDAGPVTGSGSPAPRLTGASKVLLDTAVRQETNELVAGKYFRVRSLLISTGGVQVGNPKYTLQKRQITESWMPMKRGVQSWFGWVDLGSRPATVGDVAKWRAQGSPTSWQLPDEETPTTMAAGESVVNKMSFRDVPPGYYLNDVKPLTAQQIEALPTDPAKLRAALSRNVRPEAGPEEIEYDIFSAAGRLLFEMPSPPRLRGAALRVLSELPGTTLQEHVKDPIGRVGTKITMNLPWIEKGGNPSAPPTLAMGSTGSSFIIDPATGRLLSSEFKSARKGTGITVVLESGWTDERPTPPSKKTH
ncbi:hypothetical protein EV138_7154 [Kribbella voronezhensis]|uniref:CU044_5270 family protein n=1 Tax=Kribbella voronezhensis TaxID=2512212 RepID=A0A4R7STY3_9ACTN|nr:CU044_5270 family protein [Kribbella voronezhensis]TDU82265.1 hypothetical protein EV138_7154 [Kribbella voronezhensis]